jgi:hypothetical protein
MMIARVRVVNKEIAAKWNSPYLNGSLVGLLTVFGTKDV